MNNGTFDRTSLRLAATLLLVGQVLYIMITQLHADGDANTEVERPGFGWLITLGVPA